MAKIKIEKNKKGLYDITTSDKVVHTDRNLDFIKGWLINQVNDDVKSITLSI
jgi:hypothetical protein